MSRSRKKPWVWISKAWDKHKESSYRRRTRDQLREVEIDPDKDYEEYWSNKKLGDWGTRCGFAEPPGPDDSQWLKDEYERMKRK